MQHPKSENILKVIEVFKKVLPMAKRKRHLNMDEISVQNEDHACGTVHCHGGWFAVGFCDLSNPYITFLNGGEEMAHVLGFKRMDDLQVWASENPKLWGNRRGDGMFAERAAFRSSDRPRGASNLQHIIDHWTEVYERVKALEDQQTRKDATAHILSLPMPVENTLDVKNVTIPC